MVITKMHLKKEKLQNVKKGKQTIGDEFEEMFVKPTMSEKKIVTLSKLSAITYENKKETKKLNTNIHCLS